MRTGKDRVQVEAVTGTVSIGEARVCARDIVVGDGVVVAPRGRAQEAAELARKSTASSRNSASRARRARS